MKQQTAMQELIEWVNSKTQLFVPSKGQIIEKATELLEKERQQIIKTAIECHFEGVRQSAKTSEDYIIYGQKYYNEIYNNQ